VSFLVGLIQEFEDAMYCPKKRKEYLATAVAAAATTATATTIAETLAVPSVVVAAESSNSLDDVVSTSSSSSVRAIEFFEVSPTYEALLRGELQQQRVLDDMLAKVCTLLRISTFLISMD